MTFQNSKKISKIFFSIISGVVKKNAEIHEPIFFGNELKYVKKCLDTTFISTVSPFVNKLEKEFCKYTGS